MSEYTLSEIKQTDRRANRLMDELLIKEGIQRDGNLDYSLGLFDEDYKLVATGSCFKNTLRCMAVDSSHQGEGLLNQIVTALMDHQSAIGNHELFLYTKCDSARFFGDLGFHEITRVDGKVVFMENRRDGFARYLDSLSAFNSGKEAGAIVMNANPFTRGHLYLAETAASQCEQLHIFVVSEDASLVPFEVRYELVRRGTSHLKNVTLHPSGNYIISSATFPSYFLKDSETVITSHARLDIRIFARIAAALGIDRRFVGEEPLSQVTGIYNRVMADELPLSGVQVTVIPRLAEGGSAISASTVRSLIKKGDLAAIRPLVPESTYEYFTSPAAAPVIERIRSAGEVIHY
ncbi:MAG: [Lachnospiraceae bacterium]|nr:[citrate (pro-3S)-lyase] ligase [Lachnospiraceae bacterium]